MIDLNKLRIEHDTASQALTVRLATLFKKVAQAKHHLDEAVRSAEQGRWKDAKVHANLAADIENDWLGDCDATGEFCDMLTPDEDEEEG